MKHKPYKLIVKVVFHYKKTAKNKDKKQKFR